jgi:predicted protein tyrosine phosphatase
MSHEEAVAEVNAHPKEYAVIFITNPGENPFYRPELHDLVIHAKKSLLLQFRDIELGRYDSEKTEWWLGPKPEHVEAVLKFAEDKDNFLCCCHAGVSRSSAMAYILACRNEDPKKALGMLETWRHSPNCLLVEYAAKILNKPEMASLMEEWKADHQEERYNHLF